MSEHVDILKQEQTAANDLIEVRYLTDKNSIFAQTEGGFVSLSYTDEKGETTEHPRITAHCCFPFSDPDIYISIRQPDLDGREIGLIEKLEALDKQTQKMVRQQLALRYFMPKILKINSVKDEYGYSYWDADTDRGAARFTVRIGSNSVIPVGEGRYVISDIDGNRFEIENVKNLSARELKFLELYV